MPVFLAIILLFAGQVALTDDTSDASACAPAGPDLIAGLYQFDLFQQNAIEAADRSGSEELRLSAVSKADAATQRDKAHDARGWLSAGRASFASLYVQSIVCLPCQHGEWRDRPFLLRSLEAVGERGSSRRAAARIRTVAGAEEPVFCKVGSRGAWWRRTRAEGRDA